MKRVIRCLVFLLLLLMSGPFSSGAINDQLFFDGVDSEHVAPGHIIFKLKQEAFKDLHAPQYAPEPIMLTLSGYTKSKAERVFPNHNAPVTRYHPSGVPYSDLSRIYEVVIESHNDIKMAMFDIVATGLVEYVQPRYLPKSLPYHNSTYAITGHIPYDSVLSLQCHLDMIQAFAA